LLDYLFAFIAVCCNTWLLGIALLNDIQSGTGSLSVDTTAGLAFGSIAVVSLYFSWLRERGTWYLFWHGLWHIFSAICGYYIAMSATHYIT